jgi:hypothetical protein
MEAAPRVDARLLHRRLDRRVEPRSRIEGARPMSCCSSRDGLSALLSRSCTRPRRCSAGLTGAWPDFNNLLAVITGNLEIAGEHAAGVPCRAWSTGP